MVFERSRSNTGPSWVCHPCLLGTVLPVIRPSTSQWEFGVVERTNTKTSSSQESSSGSNKSKVSHDNAGKILLRFMDGQCELVEISPTTYQEYIEHYKQLSQNTTPLPANELFSFEYESDNEADDDSLLNEYASTQPNRLNIQDPNESSCPQAYSTNHPYDSHNNLAMSPYRGVASNSPDKARDVLENTSATSSLSLSPFESPNSFTTHHSKASEYVLKSTYSRTHGDDASSRSSPKYSQKLWTPKEDQHLLEVISQQVESPLRWSMVARSIPGRSGKQCRERYLNHLTPNIKLKNWSPVEDSVIFRLHFTDGSKWSMMSRLIRGRTDNSIKNRFHHLKRRLERQVQAIPSSPFLINIQEDLTQSTVSHPDHDEFILKYAASEIASPSESLDLEDVDGYLRLAFDELCARCGMIVPSKQTGRLVCKTTAWCEVCIRLSCCVSGDLLRNILESSCMVTSTANNPSCIELLSE